MNSNAKCGMCGSTSNRIVYSIKNWRCGERAVEGATINKCRSCGVWYTWPEPTPSYGEGFDGQYDFQQLKNSQMTLKHFRELLLLEKANCIQEGFPKDFQFLDIGCSTGVVLQIAQGLGFRAQGFEVSENAIEIAKKKGFDVKKGNLHEVFKKGSPHNLL